jgi:secreted trypsin-like serine protease
MLVKIITSFSRWECLNRRGVSSRADSWFKDIGKYGVKELYTRVSTHSDWIVQVMTANETQRAKLRSSAPFLQSGMTPEHLPEICASIGFKP